MSTPEVKKKETEYRKQKRNDPEVKKKETEIKRQKWSDPIVKQKELHFKKQKRTDPNVKEMCREYMRQKRTDPHVKQREADFKREKRTDPRLQEKDRKYMRQRRLDPEVKHMECQLKKRRRQNPTIYQRESKRNKIVMQYRRKSDFYREMETVHKRTKHHNCFDKNTETIKNTLQKQRSHENPGNILNEKQKTEIRKYGRDIKELLNIFNTKTAEGPVYVCTCCQQLWFKHSVFNVDEIYLKTENEKATFNTCRTNFVSKCGKEWICKTCRNSVKEGKIPKLSIKNKMGFPQLPPELQLYSMEERLIAPRIVFMLLRDHPVGGQTFLRGKFVNVPVDIAPTVNTLPRSQ